MSREVALAARWVQRTLDDVLPDGQEPHPDPGYVRLLASHDGVLAFVPQPLFADDPLLRETWQMQSPVLAADTGLSRLTKFLALTKLDDEVQTSAVPDRVHQDDDAFTDARQKIDGIKPYLFALVRAESSRNETRVRSGLSNMELVICDELSPHYEYDGTEVKREDAVCFIASRQEGRGRRSRILDTAYLELDRDTDSPHWFAFGRQLVEQPVSPFTGLLPPEITRQARWARPVIAAEVTYLERTPSGRLRQPVWRGLRACDCFTTVN